MTAVPAGARDRPASAARARARAIVEARNGLAASAGSAWPALAAAGLALGLNVRALLPDVGLWDTAEFQAIGPVLGIAHPTGFPAYTLLAWLASVVLQPFGEPAFRANLLSAILAASAVGLLAATVQLLTGRRIPAFLAGAALAVAPLAWSIGLRADAHALHFLLASLLLAVLAAWYRELRGSDEPGELRPDRRPRADRWLVLAAVVYGVSLANHALTLLMAPGIALFVLAVAPRLPLRRPSFVIACAAATVLTTLLLYAYLPLRSAMDPPLDYANPEVLEVRNDDGKRVGGFLYLVLGEQFRGTFREFPSAAETIATVGSVLGELGMFLAPAFLGGVVLLRQRQPLFVLTVLWALLTFGFALAYENAGIERYYVIPLLVAALWAGIGLASATDALASIVPSRRALARPALAALAAVVLIVPTAAAVPDRFDRVDQSDARWARGWLAATLARLPEDAVVVSWWSFSTILWYAQYVEHARPDMTVIDDRTMIDQDLGTTDDVVKQFLGRRPLYLIRVDWDVPKYAARYELCRLSGIPGWGPIYRVDGLREPGASPPARSSRPALCRDDVGFPASSNL